MILIYVDGEYTLANPDWRTLNNAFDMLASDHNAIGYLPEAV